MQGADIANGLAKVQLLEIVVEKHLESIQESGVARVDRFGDS